MGRALSFGHPLSLGTTEVRIGLPTFSFSLTPSTSLIPFLASCFPLLPMYKLKRIETQRIDRAWLGSRTSPPFSHINLPRHLPLCLTLSRSLWLTLPHSCVQTGRRPINKSGLDMVGSI